MKMLMLSLTFLTLSTAAFSQTVNDVLKENDDLFSSFFQEDQKKVAKEAEELAAVLKKTKAPELKAVKEKLSSLTKISGKNSKEKNLEFYSAFIEPLVALVKSKKIEGYEVYFCPMVEKKWIQNVKADDEVKNVFAQNMIKCGGKDS